MKNDSQSGRDGHTRQDLIAIAKILKPVGTRGEVRVLPLTGDRRRLAGLKSVMIGSTPESARERAIRSVRFDPKYAVMTMEGVEYVEAAESLREQFLFIEKKDSIRPKSGTYFIDDIIGAEVITEDGTSVGSVREVLRVQTNDLWSVWTGEKEILIPAVKTVVKKVDVAQKKIWIHEIEGLLD
ncbi:MAG: ribosome maturation factor RimM [Bacteroidota bacterium]